MMKTRLILAILAGSLWLCEKSQAQVPSQFSVQGILRDSTGKLQSMSVTVLVQLYDAQMGGNAIGGPLTANNVPVDNGLFTVAFTVPSLASDLTSVQPWLQLTVGNDTFPRQLVTPVIYSVMAKAADSLSANCSGCVGDAHVGTGISAAKVAGALANATIAASNVTGAFTELSTGHVIGTGATPTAIVGAAAGSGATVNSITGSDTAGSISLTTGTGAAIGTYVTISFKSAYATTPSCVVSPTNDFGYNKTVVAGNTSGFWIHVTPAIGSGIVASFNWICIQ
jgi:hypothetical protein